MQTRGTYVVLAIVLLVCAAAIGYLSGRNSILDHHGCRAEDEVPVVVVRPSFDWMPGDEGCVHIDELKDAR